MGSGPSTEEKTFNDNKADVESLKRNERLSYGLRQDRDADTWRARGLASDRAKAQILSRWVSSQVEIDADVAPAATAKTVRDKAAAIREADRVGIFLETDHSDEELIKLRSSVGVGTNPEIGDIRYLRVTVGMDRGDVRLTTWARDMCDMTTVGSIMGDSVYWTWKWAHNAEKGLKHSMSNAGIAIPIAKLLQSSIDYESGMYGILVGETKVDTTYSGSGYTQATQALADARATLVRGLLTIEDGHRSSNHNTSNRSAADIGYGIMADTYTSSKPLVFFAHPWTGIARYLTNYDAVTKGIWRGRRLPPIHREDIIKNNAQVGRATRMMKLTRETMGVDAGEAVEAADAHKKDPWRVVGLRVREKYEKVVRLNRVLGVLTKISMQYAYKLRYRPEDVRLESKDFLVAAKANNAEIETTEKLLASAVADYDKDLVIWRRHYEKSPEGKAALKRYDIATGAANVRVLNGSAMQEQERTVNRHITALIPLENIASGILEDIEEDRIEWENTSRYRRWKRQNSHYREVQ
ncbi:MAG: hypothetical protein KAG66_12610, partial [Methylococcales bacterium]|nr:hypothetical protein [Methylococcales bacterium]